MNHFICKSESTIKMTPIRGFYDNMLTHCHLNSSHMDICLEALASYLKAKGTLRRCTPTSKASPYKAVCTMHPVITDSV